MYLEHFGLTEPPFRITPHTDFFFSGGNRGATLDALTYAITHDEGIVKVSGEVGSGKTMLCRVLMERLPDTVTIIYLANPSLSREDILYAIADELQLEIPENARAALVLRMLQERLIKSYSEGRQIVVLIDEAHAMPVETLEEIRLLSNLESNRNKLLQLVLFGQPELNDVLSRPDMRQLKERITHNFMLEPLIRDDVASYVDFRMRAAGYKGPSVFMPEAIKAIAATSLGLTRRINILADKALLAAFATGSHQVGDEQMSVAIKDCDFSNLSAPTKPSRTAGLLARGLAGVAVIVSIVAAYLFGISDGKNTTQEKTGSSVATKSHATLSLPPSTHPSESSPVSTVPSTPIANPAKHSLQNPPHPAESPAVAEPTPQPALGKLTRAYIDSSLHWLNETDDSRWFIQLFSTDKENAEMVEAFLSTAIKSGIDVKHLRAYESTRNNQPRIGVILGDYPNSRSARVSIEKLPKGLLVTRPYPRQVKRLR
jgi:type II secretory pathway predicted ATPase ExeA